EFFEVLTWRQIGLHRKPIYLLNTADYWTPLMTLMDHVIDQGFAEAPIRSYATLVPDVAALALRLRAVLG
ncbi:MAG: LOG family protein, partial [Rhodobacter sp.]